MFGCYVITFSLSTENAWILSLKVKTLRFITFGTNRAGIIYMAKL